MKYSLRHDFLLILSMTQMLYLASSLGGCSVIFLDGVYIDEFKKKRRKKIKWQVLLVALVGTAYKCYSVVSNISLHSLSFDIISLSEERMQSTGIYLRVDGWHNQRPFISLLKEI